MTISLCGIMYMEGSCSPSIAAVRKPGESLRGPGGGETVEKMLEHEQEQNEIKKIKIKTTTNR